MPTSYGFNVARERLRTSGPMELIAGVALIAAVCWLVFPRNLVSSLRQAPVDAVTLSYTDNWLRAKPDDYALRLLLANRLVDMGLLDRARAQLGYIRTHTTDPQWRAPQRWLSARLAFGQLMALPPAARTASPLESEVRRDFVAIDPRDLDDDQLEQYADMAINLGRPAAAVQAFNLIAGSRPQPAFWYRKGAAVLLSRGLYREAADQYLRAEKAEPDHAGARRDFLDAVGTLQAGNLLPAALDLARRQRGPFMGDQEVLYRLMNLARAADDHGQAQFYAERLLQLGQSPDTKRAGQ